jgi:hypothetical protein
LEIQQNKFTEYMLLQKIIPYLNNQVNSKFSNLICSIMLDILLFTALYDDFLTYEFIEILLKQC